MKPRYLLSAVVLMFGVSNAGWAVDEDGIHNKARADTDYSNSCSMLDIVTDNAGRNIISGTLRITGLAGGVEATHDFAMSPCRTTPKGGSDCYFTLTVTSTTGRPYKVEGYYLHGVARDRSDDCVILSWASEQSVTYANPSAGCQCEVRCQRCWGYDCNGCRRCYTKCSNVCVPYGPNPCDSGTDMLDDVT